MGFFTTYRKSRTRDGSAFHDFYQATLRPLTCHLQALGLRQAQELEDILQNTYLEAHKAFGDLQDPQAALAWLMTIGRRQYYKHLSRQIRHRKFFVEQNPEDMDGANQAVDPLSRAADEMLHTASLCHKIVRRIDATTDPRRRQALRMFFLEDHSLKEISLSITVNVSTLTTWISRFRKDVDPLLSDGRKTGANAAEDMVLTIQEVFP